jgi:hypothetical protein
LSSRAIKTAWSRREGTYDLFEAVGTQDKTLVLLGDREHLIFEANPFKDDITLGIVGWLNAHSKNLALLLAAPLNRREIKERAKIKMPEPTIAGKTGTPSSLGPIGTHDRLAYPGTDYAHQSAGQEAIATDAGHHTGEAIPAHRRPRPPRKRKK